jgi:hypothetical protein
MTAANPCFCGLDGMSSFLKFSCVQDMRMEARTLAK